MRDFEALIERYHDELYIFIYSYVHNNEIAKDALQNTLITAYKSFNSLRDKEKFKSWIFTIGKREALRQLGKFKKDCSLNGVEEKIISLESSRDDLPEDSLLNEEVREKIIEAIKSLKDELREIILMKYYHEISFEDIARMNSINVNTVRSRHMRAKKKIQEYLLQNYFNKIW